MGNQVPTKELATIKEWLSGMDIFEIATKFYSFIEGKGKYRTTGIGETIHTLEAEKHIKRLAGKK